MSLALKRKVRRLRAIKQEAAQLEREILEEGFMAMQTPNERLLAKPRLERVMEMFA